MQILEYAIYTLEVDVADGYPEYHDTFTEASELTEVANRANTYGVPSHRLSVEKNWMDDGGNMQHDQVGNLQEVLDNPSLLDF